jgi:FixJ family two-component response regulator
VKTEQHVVYELGIAERTINAHRKNVMANSFAELASIAERIGVLASSHRRVTELAHDP